MKSTYIQVFSRVEAQVGDYLYGMSAWAVRDPVGYHVYWTTRDQIEDGVRAAVQNQIDGADPALWEIS